jgi:hypothetical protein
VLLSKAPRPLINARTLQLVAACGPVKCAVAAGATVKLPGSTRVWRLGTANVTISPNGQKAMTLKVSYALRQAVRGYLLLHPHYQVKVTVRLTMTHDGRVVQTITRTLPIWTYVRFR